MKMIFSKERKRPRVFAFALAVMLALTPLYSFSGIHNGSKAATPKEYTFNLSTERNIDLSKDVTGTQENMSMSEESLPVPKKIYVGSENSAKVEDTISLNGTSFTDTNNKTWTIKEKKVAIIVTPTGTNPDANAISDATYTEKEGTISVSETLVLSSRISVYMKVSTWDGTDPNTETTSAPFLVATYDITLDASSPLSDTKWVDGDGSEVNSSNYYNNATITAPESGYSVKYLIKEVPDAGSAPELDTDEDWKETMSAISIPNTTNGEKIYGYVGLFDDNGGLITYEHTRNTLKYDKEGPEVTVSLQKIKNELKDNDSSYCSDEGNWKTIGTIDKNTSSGTFNTKGSDKNIYRIKVTVSDPNANGGTINGGVLTSWSYPNTQNYGSYLSIYTQLSNDGNNCSLVDNNGIYYYTVFSGAPYMCTSKTKVAALTSITVTDRLGNATTKSITYTEDIDAPVVKIEGTDGNTTPKNYGISETGTITPSPSNLTKPEDNLIIYKEPEIYVNVAEQATATGTIASGLESYTYEITKDGVSQGENTVECVSDSEDLQFDATYFPTSGKYKFSIYGTDKAGNDSTVATYDFYVDNSPATVTSKGIYVNINGTYTPIADDYVNEDGNLYINYNAPECDYRYYYEIKDDFSGVYDESSHNITAGDMNGWGYATVPSNLAAGTTGAIAVSDKDNYGNVSASPIALSPGYKIVRTGIQDTDITFAITDRNKKVVYPTPSGSKYLLPKNRLLRITATSDRKIEKMVVDTDKTNTTSGKYVSTILSTDISNTYNYKTGRYEGVAYIEIPKQYDNAADIQYAVTAYDENGGHNVTEATTDSYIYALTSPKLHFTKAGDFNATKWYKVSEASFVYEIAPTLDNAQTPSLNYVNYTYENCSDGRKNITIYEDGVRDKTFTGTVVVPESASVNGTKITFDSKDNAGNDIETTGDCHIVYVKIDGTNPVLADMEVTGTTKNSVEYAGIPTIKSTITDNLTIGKVDAKITYPDGGTEVLAKTYQLVQNNASAGYEFDWNACTKPIVDGEYTIEFKAFDMAGNESDTKTVSFTIDNTIPVVNTKISSGTTAGKTPMKNNDGTSRDYYYSSDVNVGVSYIEKNMVEVTVTDNGEELTVDWSYDEEADKYYANVVATSEGKHVITISGKDSVGQLATPKSVEFVIDKTAPSFSRVINGGIVYNDSMGFYYLTGDASIQISENETNADESDFYYQVLKYEPGSTTPSGGDFIKGNSRLFGFSEEGEYTVNVYSIDRAGNKSGTYSTSVRIDRTAPEITINGAPRGGTTSSATSVSFVMEEAFWRDASGKVTIYRKAGDGKEETVYKTINITPTGRETTVSESLTETGVYRFEFDARDDIGHKVNMSQTFTVDRDAPVVALEGVRNYDKTTTAVTMNAEITDEFFQGKKVSVSGTRTDMDGKSTALSFHGVIESANPTRVNETFEKDGIYDIHIEVKDLGGNVKSTDVHFTIDSTKPVIADIESLKSAKNGDSIMLKSFTLEEDLEDIVSDLTVCDVHMYLNGVEYDGTEDLEDGSYVLLITADDELGNHAEKKYEFVLDTKAPVFIVTGVEDGEVKNENYSIDISLQLEEDTLTSVKLNGESVTVKDNQANLSVTDKGDYELTMEAVDEAGNTATETISFRYGEKKDKSPVWLYIGGGAGILVAVTIIFGLLKRRKK